MNLGSRLWKNATITLERVLGAKYIVCAVSSNSSASAIDNKSDWFSSRFEIASWMGGSALSLGTAAQHRT